MGVLAAIVRWRGLGCFGGGQGFEGGGVPVRSEQQTFERSRKEHPGNEVKQRRGSPIKRHLAISF